MSLLIEALILGIMILSGMTLRARVPAPVPLRVRRDSATRR
ncbi:hypothetical protein EDC31_1365 [Acidomonas methanolica]|nr:hypothetical protein EDC31_1365 [Acidomonas methanolica]